MLVCPKCHSENPNNSQVCQHCQTSLVHYTCPHCGNDTPFSEPYCQECGAFNGQLWQVIVTQPIKSEQTDDNLSFNDKYLDLRQRYQIWSDQEEVPFQMIATTATHKIYQGQVVDCQPLEKSTLPVLISGLLQESEQDDPTLLWEQMGIPRVAFPYLILKDLNPIIPEVYDAWVDNETDT